MADAEKSPPDPPTVEHMAERLKERIYAALTVLAVIVGLALGGEATHLAVALSVLGTTVGLWLATLAAESQAHRIVYGRLTDAAELRHMLFVSSPLLSAAVSPLLLVGLSALGVLPLPLALWISVGAGLLSLFVWGCVSGRRMGAGLLAASVVGVVNLLIGAIVIGVKLAAGH